MKAAIVLLFTISTIFATSIFAQDGGDRHLKTASIDHHYSIVQDGSDRTLASRHV